MPHEPKSPLDPFLETAGVVVLDGGLATELEQRGHDLDDPLWSAKLLLTDPDAIGDVHRAYLEAGADCLISATYQASIPGLIARGLSEVEAARCIERGVTIALEARDTYVASRTDSSRPRPIVAASVGPYGASLADGAEYRGDYGLDRDALFAFHELRWSVLADSGAELLACETLPSAEEAGVLLELLEGASEALAWFSFSCRDGGRISDGTPIADCAARLAGCDRVIAIGVNCTAPRHVSSLIGEVRRGAPNKPVVVYPNSGQTWDGKHRAWAGDTDPVDFGALARDWRDHGASVIGGCCQTGPQHVREIRAALI